MLDTATHHVPKAQPKPSVGLTKLQFFLTHYEAIIRLEDSLCQALQDVKTREGGWVGFKDACSLQTVFKEEKTFFQALSFVKRIEICQNVQGGKEQNTSNNLVVRLN